MPRYCYRCNVCDRVETGFRSLENRNRIDPCGNGCTGVMVRALPKVQEPTIMETADKHRNVKWRKNQKERLDKRAKDFFRKNEMHEQVAKVGEKEAKRLGWVKKDGKLNKGD